MSIRAGFVFPSRKTRAQPSDHFGDARLCLVYLSRGNCERNQCFAVGILRVRAAHLERLAEEGKQVDATLIGLLRVTPDVSPALVDKTLGDVRVFGPVWASRGVRRVIHTRR